MDVPVGRRERKKARTRQSLAEAAMQLFLERGYERVGVKDVADAADVSVTTLFKHFPSKEALVFDEDDGIEAALIAAVRDRAPGQSIPAALKEHILTAARRESDPEFTAFNRLVDGTPALRDYAKRLWARYETALAGAVAEDVGAPGDDVACLALARFSLEARDLIWRSADPRRSADRIFRLLEDGWAAVQARPLPN